MFEEGEKDCSKHTDLTKYTTSASAILLPNLRGSCRVYKEICLRRNQRDTRYRATPAIPRVRQEIAAHLEQESQTALTGAISL